MLIRDFVEYEFIAAARQGASNFIARTPGCVRNDSETHDSVLLDCATGESGRAIQLH